MSLAFIGGSGIYDIEGVEELDSIKISTPFGDPSDEIKKLSINDREFYFLPRHGRGHKITPSEINYRANIFALKSLGVNSAISISAVGSLTGELAPETFVIPNQFIDWTKGFRKRSFFGDGLVGHVSLAHPIHKPLAKFCQKTLENLKVKNYLGGTYICIEGPGFSTRAESLFYKDMGASIIGMTNVPESFLAKEAGISYVSISMVTDYDCWKEEHCTVEEIMKVMGTNSINAKKFVKEIVENFNDADFEPPKDNQNAVVTDPSLFTNEHKAILEVLLK